MNNRTGQVFQVMSTGNIFLILSSKEYKNARNESRELQDALHTYKFLYGPNAASGEIFEGLEFAETSWDNHSLIDRIT